MSPLLFSLATALFLATTIIVATAIFSRRAKISAEKITPFECGFDPNSSARIPFSLQFFILAMIFLVFDIEIALLMPAPLMRHSSPIFLTLMIMFITILLIGLYHEWHEGSLEWK